MPNQRPANKYALCVGIGDYTDSSMQNRALRYAASDATDIAEVLRDPTRGAFDPAKVEVKITQPDTEAEVLKTALDNLLNGPDRQPQDLALIFIAGHGGVFGDSSTFYLYASDTEFLPDPQRKPKKVLDIFQLAGLFDQPKVKNIIIWLDVCYADNMGDVIAMLRLQQTTNMNIFVAGAARRYETARQDSILRHGVFTHCLLEAFKQKPGHSDGWLTPAEIQSFIEREITKYSDTATFPANVRAENLFSLSLIQNPDYHPDNLKFRDEVKDFLKLQGYQPEADLEDPHAPPTYYIAIKDKGSNEQSRGVLTYDNTVVTITSDYINRVLPFLEAQLRDEVLDVQIVTRHKLPATSEAAFRQKLGRQRVKFTTKDSISSNLVRFDPFLEKWRKAFEEDARFDDDFVPPLTLSKVYIPLRAEKRLYENRPNAWPGPQLAKKPQRRSELDEGWQKDEDQERYRVEKVDELDAFVDQWLADPKLNRLALLGSYGTGKSTYCLHLSAEWFKLRQTQPATRLPIYIQLKIFAEATPDIKQIADYIGREGNTSAPNYDALERMAQEGQLLFILDGFDEMATQANSGKLKRNIQLFEKLAGLSNNKVLLTTRPEYFAGADEEHEILRNYPRLYLQPYTEAEVKKYLALRLRDPEKASQYWSEICGIYDLPDLAERPVFLEMIVKTLPEFIESNRQTTARRPKITRPLLYEKYLKGELERQKDKERLDYKMGDEKRFEIMEVLALEFYRSGKLITGLNESEVHELFRYNEVLTAEERGDMARHTRDILTCSFLIKPVDTYQFSHNSFREYLLARCLRKALQPDARPPKANKEDFGRYELSIPTLEFLAEMLKPDANDHIVELETAVNWLSASTATTEAETGEVEFGLFQQNLAGLFLAHRLLTPLPGTLSSYITNAEYQLFVEESQAQNRYYQPPHWQSYRFEQGRAWQPIRGVTYNAASNFSYWLGNRHKGSYEYRLPTQEAAAESPLPGLPDLATWLQNGELAGLADTSRQALKAQVNLITGFPDLARDRARALDLALDRALARARSAGDEFEMVTTLIMGERFEEALQRVREINQPTFNTLDQRTAALIIDLLEMRLADTFPALSQAHRRYVNHYVEYVLIGLGQLEQEEKQPGEYDELKELLQKVAGWVKMVEARIKGELPAWEGIRIVRERKKRE